MGEIAVICVLAFWMLLILVGQSRSKPIEQLLGRFRISLFPLWTVFLRRDQLLVLTYRDWPINDSEPGEWIEVPGITKNSFAALFWDPNFYRSHGLMRALRQIGLRAEAEHSGEIETPMEENFWYQLICDHVSSLPAEAGVKRRQFRIKRTGGFFTDEPPMEWFCSEPFEIPTEVAAS